jgi:hypothetical protein
LRFILACRLIVFDRFEDLSLCAENRVLRLFGVTVGHERKRRIVFLLQASWPLEFGLSFDRPGAGGLPEFKCLGLAMDDLAAFLDDDLGGRA